MKKVLILSIIVAFTIPAFTQTPQKLSYQAVLRDKDGNLLVNQLVGMRTTILQGSTIQLVVYQETYTFTATNENGLLTVEIGSGKPTIVSGPFTSIPWSSGPFFLKTEIDPAGGTNYTITGQSPILSVPYALYAEKTGTLSETDPVFGTSPAKGITWTNLGNWNTAFSWGDHRELYRSSSYVPDWSEITTKPTTVTGYAITDAVTTSGNQTITGDKSFTGKTTVIPPVNPGDAVNKKYVDALLKRIKFLETLAGVYEDIIDKDGNIYKAIKIGNQVWLAENLRTTRYNDSTLIPHITDNTAWINLNTPAYCWYNNESVNGDIYGALYNFYAVDTKKLCPTGFSVPTYDEWLELITFIGGAYGNKLKDAVGLYWINDNNNATNETGFSARPGGARDGNTFGVFLNIGEIGLWWGYEYSTAFQLYTGISQIGLHNTMSLEARKSGLSVRCIKD